MSTPARDKPTTWDTRAANSFVTARLKKKAFLAKKSSKIKRNIFLSALYFVKKALKIDLTRLAIF